MSPRPHIRILLSLCFFAIVIILVSFFIKQQQDTTQHAAGQGADLIPEAIQLTDAAGNVKNTFYINEDIYVRVTITNQGDAAGVSSDGRTISHIYTNQSSPVAFNTPSDINMYLNNGEFGTGSTKIYESHITGQGQNVFTPNPYDDTSTRHYSWRKATGGSYTARMLVNANQNVSEADYTNNQIALSYQVVPFTTADEVGTQSLTKPADFDEWPCVVRNSIYVTGFTGCIQQIRGPDTKVQGKITNNTSQTTKVTIASYKAYLPWVALGCTSLECAEQYDFAWTQTFHRAETYDLRPGDTIYLSTNLPSCAWQADLFVIGTPFSFHPNITYQSSGIGYIDGWYHFYPTYDQNNTTYCTQSIPTPTLTPTPTTKPNMILPLTIFLHNIGNSGDSQNPDAFSLSNHNPLTPVRNVTVSLFDSQGAQKALKVTTMTYNNTNGNFQTSANMGPVASGTYTVKIKTDKYLRKQIPGFITYVTTGQPQAVSTTLVAGDTNNDNALNILDYNMIIDCYSGIAPAKNCSDPQKKFASDLTDDGKVNQVDYNLFLRELGVQAGD